MGLANIAVTVQFGSAPQGACTPSSLNGLIGQLNTLIAVTNSTTGNVSYFNYGDTTPSPENRIYPWLTITNAQWYNYVGGSWVPVNPSHIWYAGGTTGAADVYVASTVATYPSVLTLTVGDVFLITINIENTGPSTLSMNSLAAAALTVGTTPLTAGQLEADSTYLVCWDGTRFRVLNPTVSVPASPVSVSTSALLSLPAAGSTTTFAHGFASVPTMYSADFVCVTNNNGYVTIPPDRIPFDSVATGGSNNEQQAFILSANSTSLVLTQENGSFPNRTFLNKTTGAPVSFVASEWNLEFNAVLITP